MSVGAGQLGQIRVELGPGPSGAVLGADRDDGGASIL